MATLTLRLRGSFLHAITPAAFVVMWASGAIAVQYGLLHTSVATFLLLRASGTSLLSWGMWFIVRDQLPSVRAEWLRVCGVGLLLQVVYQGFFFLALSTSMPAGIVAVIVGFQPVLTALVARSAHTYALWFGLMLGFAGISLTLVSGAQDGDSRSVAGMVFSLIALAGITFGTLIQGQLKRIGIWASLALQSSISTSVFFAISLLGGQLRAQPGLGLLAAVGWMVAVVSVGATALLYVMIGRGEAVRVSSLFYCVPPVTALLDLVFLEGFSSCWKLSV